MVGRSARVVPVSEWRTLDTCSVVLRSAASINPTEHAALNTLKIGSTMPIMMSKPLPSSPSIAERGILTPLARTGEESLPRRPRPSNGPCTAIPLDPAGTSQIVLAPSAASGFDDQTYAVAREAEVTQLFCAFKT